MPIFKNFNHKFFKKWTPEMAYVLGFIYADGTIFLNQRGAYFLEITSTDLEIVRKIKSALNSEHKIGVKLKNNPKWKTSYRLQIGSKNMIRDLMSFGLIQRKSLVIGFPKISDKYLGHFVRGYFDGDGCVHLGKYLKKDRKKLSWSFTSNFTSGSKKFLFHLLQSLKIRAINGSIYKKKGGYTLVFSRHDSVALFKLMYNNVSSRLFLERKRNVFLKAFRVLKYKVAGVA